MTKELNYEDPKVRARMEARIQALSIAHDRDSQPDEVVARAKAYIEFVETADGHEC